MRAEQMLALAEEVLVAAGNGDREATLRAFHPEMTLVTTADWPDGGEFRGREQAWGFISSFVATFRGGSFRIDEPFVEGDRLLARIHRHGTGGHSGAAVEFDATMLWTFKEGLILRQQYFWTRAEALEVMKSS
jgi:ketosteroid isomerase-like protein